MNIGPIGPILVGLVGSGRQDARRYDYHGAALNSWTSAELLFFIEMCKVAQFFRKQNLD